MKVSTFAVLINYVHHDKTKLLCRITYGAVCLFTVACGKGKNPIVI